MQSEHTIVASAELSRIVTPLHAEAWEACLQNHPDRLFAQYISNGVRCGFRIGYNRESKVISAKNNMISTAAHPSVVADYIAKELLKGRTIPWHSVPAQVSRFGVIPKKHQPDEC